MANWFDLAQQKGKPQRPDLSKEESEALALLNWVAGREVVPQTSAGLVRAGGVDGIVKQLIMEPNFGKFALKAFDTAETRERIVRDFFRSRQSADTPVPTPE